MELGSELWKNLVCKYRTFGKKQKVIIPSFQILNKIFEPASILESNLEKVATLRVRPSITNMEDLDKER